jgi:hypothetical protein
MSPRGKGTSSGQHARLGDDIIEAVECLKSIFDIVSFNTGTEVEQAEKVLLGLRNRAEQLEDTCHAQRISLSC